MFLSLSTLPSYLTSRGHISPNQWFDDGLLLAPAPGRHANFAIRNAAGSGVFVKQLRQTNCDLVAAQSNEAAMLTAIQQWACWADQRLIAPRLVDQDPSRHALIIDYIDGNSFYESYVSLEKRGDVAGTKRISIHLGEVLARFHFAGRQVQTMNEPQKQKLRTELPAAITLQPPNDTIHGQLSPVCLQLLESIQNDPVFIHQLRNNASYWQQETVIHGDLKWDNVVVTDLPNARVRLVDWELAAIGDPAWDVAGVLQSFATHAAEQPTSTAMDCEKPHRDGDAFWAAYIDSSPSGLDQHFADRVRRFFSARLIQTVLEREQQSQSLGNASNRLMQISRQVLCESGSNDFPGN